MTLGTFLGLFFLVTSPMIVFQTVAYSVSVAHLFLPLQATVDTLKHDMVLMGLFAVGVYGIQAVILYFVAKYNPTRLRMSTLLIVLAMFAVTIYKITHA